MNDILAHMTAYYCEQLARNCLSDFEFYGLLLMCMAIGVGVGFALCAACNHTRGSDIGGE